MTISDMGENFYFCPLEWLYRYSSDKNLTEMYGARRESRENIHLEFK